MVACVKVRPGGIDGFKRQDAAAPNMQASGAGRGAEAKGVHPVSSWAGRAAFGSGNWKAAGLSTGRIGSDPGAAIGMASVRP
jgi:hypothetical protein